MTNLRSYPHYEINVEDRSIFNAIATDDLPLHRPFYPMRCQKGPIGVPVWCPTITEAKATYGAETFNVYNSTYYGQASEFLNTTFPNNGAWIIRMADEAIATDAWVILEIGVEANAAVPQWQKDANGDFILDTGGDPIQEDDGGPVAEAGLTLNWHTRIVFEPSEEVDTLEQRTEGAVTYYPIISFKATSPGAWGNDIGFKFYSDPDESTADKVARVDALYFTLAPMQKDFGKTDTDPIRDRFTNTFNSFVFKPDSLDQSIAKRVSLSDIMENAYNAAYPLPYTIYASPANVLALGEAIKAVEVNRNGDNVGIDDWATEEITDGWLANIVSLTDLDGRPYDHVITDNTGNAVLTESVIHYLASGTINGTDDAMDDADLETHIADFLSGSMNPDINDKPRYPFTHMIDVGYSIDIKNAMCDFLALRDDVEIVMSTQDASTVNGTPVLNTAALDESVGTAVRSRAMLVPESVIKGTGAFRAIIFQQAGYTNSLYTGIIPATLWYASKLAQNHNVDYMKGSPEGLPDSAIELFKEWNWTPAIESAKETAWDTGLNYFQYYSRTGLHYAALRTVYEADTSVLNIADFVNAVIYTKHEIRQSWAKFAGVTRKASVLQTQVTDDLDARLSRVYNGRYEFSTRMYQTEEEALLGYAHHIEVNITSPANNRVWTVDIVCNRENFEG